MQSDILNNVSRLLVMRLDNIGDIIMTGPALRTLKDHLLDSHITLLASPAGSQATPLLPWVDDVITWRAVWHIILHVWRIVPRKGSDAVIISCGGKHRMLQN
jgi:ADP-heptose:LPS heptosyltransferase